MDIRGELELRIKTIDEALEKRLPKLENERAEIYDAMRYSLFAGGKRLRPMLMWEACGACGGSWEDVEPFACALEMIHTYSLIHDDLPAMDNDDLRRGLPTNHIKFGEAIAILAGDALLNKAFEIISSERYEYPERALKAIAVLAESSGTEGMIGGQVLDLESENRQISPEELKHIHRLKTGALIRAACIIGGIMAGADKSEINALDIYAENLGIAFQIQDDILDVTGSEEELGKPIGSDKESGKNTYVSLYGIEKAKQLMKEYSENAKEAVSALGDGAGFLTVLTEYLVNRRK